jgi:hypothetical protein
MSAIAFENANHIIRRSLEREIGLLEMKKRITDGEIRDLEQKHGMDSTQFLDLFEKGRLGDAQEWFLWWGLLKGRAVIEEELTKARAVLSL